MTDVCTALTLVIPQQFHDSINEIRKEHDKAFPRWMPHINFIFPFVPTDRFDDVSDKLRAKLEGFNPFTLELTEVGFFPQGKNATFHLKPKDISKLKKLFDLITCTLPDVKVKHAEFNPHLTLGQCKKSDVNSMLADVKSKLPNGVTFTVDKVYLISRPSDGQFSVHTEIMLQQY